MIAYEIVLGITAGFVAGKITSKMLQFGSHNAVWESLLLLSFTYLTYFITQLVFGNYNLSVSIVLKQTIYYNINKL